MVACEPKLGCLLCLSAPLKSDYRKGKFLVVWDMLACVHGAGAVREKNDLPWRSEGSACRSWASELRSRI